MLPAAKAQAQRATTSRTVDPLNDTFTVDLSVFDKLWFDWEIRKKNPTQTAQANTTIIKTEEAAENSPSFKQPLKRLDPNRRPFCARRLSAIFNNNASTESRTIADIFTNRQPLPSPSSSAAALIDPSKKA